MINNPDRTTLSKIVSEFVAGLIIGAVGVAVVGLIMEVAGGGFVWWLLPVFAVALGVGSAIRAGLFSR